MKIVSTTLRRLPGFAIAILALVMSASLAFAGQPVSTGPTNAASHSGKAVPTRATVTAKDDQDAETDEATETDTDTETEAPSDSADNCTVDLTQDPSVLETLNHGSVVCSAAHIDTPEGYATHGAWVSHWAHLGKAKFNDAPNTHGKSGH
jgi:cytoskeletal protein RodZ